jgi:hypothetical protein
MVGLLLAFGVGAELVVASVLAYRALAIWLPLPLGLLALARLRRTVGRWRAEDAAAPAAVRMPCRDVARERGGHAVPAQGRARLQRELHPQTTSTRSIVAGRPS